MTLLKQFKNELIEFDAKGRVLPEFDEVLSVSSQEDHLPTSILAKNKSQFWIWQVSEKKCTEKDILDFLRRSSALKRNRAKKVLITLSGIDQNAKLLAKNKNIWNLNLKKINTLMDFYGQPKIIAFEK